jgi:hypothetical protein
VFFFEIINTKLYVKMQTITTDSEISDEERREFKRAKDAFPSKIDEINRLIKEKESHNVYHHPVSYISIAPMRKGLERFDYTSDFSIWVAKQNKKNDFKDWDTIPRHLRSLYTPFSYMKQPTKIKLEYKSLLVRNLASETTGFQLREIFAEYGYIRDVHIPINHKTGEKCNYAFIEIALTVSLTVLLGEMMLFSTLNGKKFQVQEAVSGRKSAEEMRRRYDSCIEL